MTPGKQILIGSELTAVAKVLSSWGVKGEVKALPLSDSCSILAPGMTVSLVHRGGSSRDLQISAIKRLPKALVIGFAGIHDVDTASALAGQTICATINQLPPLSDGKYYYHQIIGLSVISTLGKSLGKVVDIFPTGSNDVYVVSGTGKEYLIPAIRDVICSIDIERREITIREIDGLLE